MDQNNLICFIAAFVLAGFIIRELPGRTRFERRLRVIPGMLIGGVIYIILLSMFN